MNYFSYFPLAATTVIVLLLLLFCYNCASANEENFWGTIIPNRRNRDPCHRCTITAPTVMFCGQAEVFQNRHNNKQHQENITIA